MNGCVCRLSSLFYLLPLFAQEVAVDPVVRFSRQVPKAEFLYVVPDGRETSSRWASRTILFPVSRNAAPDQAELRLMPGIRVLRHVDRQVSGIGWRDDCGHLYRREWRRESNEYGSRSFGVCLHRGFDDVTEPSTTEGVVQKQPTSGASPTGFVVKLTNDLTSVWFSTYLGGAATTRVTAVAADYLGNAYLTGVTDARDFPTSGGAFRTTSAAGMAFYTKLRLSRNHVHRVHVAGCRNSCRDRVRYQWRRMDRGSDHFHGFPGERRSRAVKAESRR